MKKLLLCFVMLGMLIPASFACLNEMSVTADGKKVNTDGLPRLVPKGKDHAANKAKYQTKLMKYYDSWLTDSSLVAYSDYGVMLVYLGRNEEAKKVFQEIEQLSPGLYATAANIGTVYELLGQNDSALYWIKESVRINPAAHDSSEWLHVNILQAKIKGDKYITSEFLIGTSFGDKPKPVTTLSKAQLTKLGRAIFYQLHERMSFVKPKEKIVARLLFELGNIASLSTSVISAVDNYVLADKYGFEEQVMRNRWAHFANLQHTIEGGIDLPHPPMKKEDTTVSLSSTADSTTKPIIEQNETPAPKEAIVVDEEHETPSNNTIWIMFGMISLVIGSALVWYFKRRAK